MDRSLDDWLAHATVLHPVGIDLGLARVSQVAERLGFEAPRRAPAPRSVIVAGTNGKGSTCVALEQLLLGSGLKVGTTLSPHVHRFHERVRIDGVEVNDQALCRAFAEVEAARGELTLSYFEFSALVALIIFRDAAVDVAVLEVGLGGRLDAFNLVSADVAVITSIGLDHQQYLGHDLEGIGREKAGVMRAGQDVVLGAEVTASVVHRAAELGCRTWRYGADFAAREGTGGWDYRGPALQVDGIPWSSVPPHNGALALTAAARLADLDVGSARASLGRCRLPGRFEQRRAPGTSAPLILDVAHNPAGAAFLRRLLARRCPGRRFAAVVGMLDDKDAAGVAAALGDVVDVWICVPTLGERGLAAEVLAARLRSGMAAAKLPVADPRTAPDPAAALAIAASSCPPGGGILAFGSFNLVERMRALLDAGASNGPSTGDAEQ
ncbi:MAG: Mur ligase family protein [Pseudomonadales bacterium]